MKKRITIWLKAAFVAAMGSLAVLLTGCGISVGTSGDGSGITAEPVSESAANESLFSEDGTEPCNLAIIYGNRKGCRKPDLSLCTEELTTLCERGGRICIVIPDGDPDSNFLCREVVGVDSKLEKSARSYKVTQNVATIKTTIEEMAAQTAEAKVLDAVFTAVREFSDLSEADGEFGLVILDSGISTSGKLSFSTLQDLDAQGTVNNLAAYNNIADLSKFRVKMFGLCQTASPQLTPTETDRINVQALWEDIFTRGNAKSVYINQRNLSSESVDPSLPDVSPVEISDENITIATVTTTFETLPKTTDETCTIPLNRGTVIEVREEFVENQTDQLVDPDQARNDLKVLADSMNSDENKDVDVILLGMIASVKDSPDAGVSFSQARAETIKQILVGLGVDANRINTYGAGYNSELAVNVGTEEEPIWEYLHKNDLDKNENLIPDIAQQNRVVYVVTSDSDLAKIVNSN